MLKFRMAAKTDMGLVRKNNEDNFQAAADLSSGQMRWVNNEVCSLGEKGALLVVADGMGGMNAGEVASALAIETVRESFALENLTNEVTKNRFSIEKFMNETIVAADERIKAEAREHPESRGMGTTIVLGWVYKDKLYVSWCGDSRAYIYNPKAGLHQITKDHSYVQSLVDKGTITREDAFDFPDSNIIIRSLSDSPTKAKPESLMQPYDLCNEDIILLCTDGLCGMIRDEEIETVIRANDRNLDILSDELIQAACDAEGSDNITICLFKVIEGGGVCDPNFFIETEKWLNGKQNSIVGTVIKSTNNARKNMQKIFVIFAFIFFVCSLGFGIYSHIKSRENNTVPQAETDSTNSKSEAKDSIENDSTKKTKIKGYTEATVSEEENDEASSSNADNSRNTQTFPFKTEPRDEVKDTDLNLAEEEHTEDSTDDTDLNPADDVSEDKNATTKTVEDEGTAQVQEEGSSSEEDFVYYTVRKRDTLYSLAKDFKITVEDLKEINGLTSDTIHIGQKLKVPNLEKKAK